MTQTTNPIRWVKWLLEHNQNHLLEMLLIADPSWVTTEVADHIWPTLNKRDLDLVPSVTQAVYSHMSPPGIRELVHGVTAQALLRFCEVDNIWNNLPAGTKQQLIHHPSNTIRLLVAAHPQFTQQQRFEALTSTRTVGGLPVTHSSYSDNPDLPQVSDWELGDLNETQKQELLTSPLIEVAAAGWWEFYPPTNPTLTYWEVAELLTKHHQNRNEHHNQRTGKESFDVRSLDHRSSTLAADSLVDYLNQSGFYAADGYRFPTNWISTKPSDFVHATINFEAIAEHVQKFGTDETALNRSRTNITNYTKIVEHQSPTETPHQQFTVFAEQYPHLAGTPQVWNNLVEVAVRDFGQQEDGSEQWGGLFTLHKPNWTAEDVWDGVKKYWDNLLTATTETQVVAVSCYSAGYRLMKHLSTEPNMSGENMGKWAVRMYNKAFPIPNETEHNAMIFHYLVDNLGPVNYVRMFVDRIPASTLLERAPAGVSQYLTERWPNIEVEDFLTIACQDYGIGKPGTLTIPQICGMLP